MRRMLGVCVVVAVAAASCETSPAKPDEREQQPTAEALSPTTAGAVTDDAGAADAGRETAKRPTSPPDAGAAKPVPLEETNGRDWKPDPALTKLSKVPADTKISMSRTACYGRCPVYTVTISADGAVAWNGKRFVAVTGKRTRKISKKAVLGLLHRFGEVDFMNIDEARMKASCKMRATDNPTVGLTVTVAGRSNEISDYHGCMGHPLRKALHGVEDEVQRVAVDPDWLH